MRIERCGEGDSRQVWVDDWMAYVHTGKSARSGKLLVVLEYKGYASGEYHRRELKALHCLLGTILDEEKDE